MFGLDEAIMPKDVSSSVAPLEISMKNKRARIKRNPRQNPSPRSTGGDKKDRKLPRRGNA